MSKFNGLSLEGRLYSKTEKSILHIANHLEHSKLFASNEYSISLNLTTEKLIIMKEKYLKEDAKSNVFVKLSDIQECDNEDALADMAYRKDAAFSISTSNNQKFIL